MVFQVKDICNELDVRSLCHKILQNVSTLLHADRGSLFLVQSHRPCTIKKNNRKIHNSNSNTGMKNTEYDKNTQRNESQNNDISCPRAKCLVSKLFDVCSKSTLVETERKDEIPITVGLVAESGESINIPDAYRVNIKIQLKSRLKLN